MIANTCLVVHAIAANRKTSLHVARTTTCLRDVTAGRPDILGTIVIALDKQGTTILPRHATRFSWRDDGPVAPHATPVDMLALEPGLSMSNSCFDLPASVQVAAWYAARIRESRGEPPFPTMQAYFIATRDLIHEKGNPGKIDNDDLASLDQAIDEAGRGGVPRATRAVTDVHDIPWYPVLGDGGHVTVDLSGAPRRFKPHAVLHVLRIVSLMTSPRHAFDTDHAGLVIVAGCHEPRHVNTALSTWDRVLDDCWFDRAWHDVEHELCKRHVMLVKEGVGKDAFTCRPEPS